MKNVKIFEVKNKTKNQTIQEQEEYVYIQKIERSRYDKNIAIIKNSLLETVTKSLSVINIDDKYIAISGNKELENFLYEVSVKLQELKDFKQNIDQAIMKEKEYWDNIQEKEESDERKSIFRIIHTWICATDYLQDKRMKVKF